MTNIKLTLLAAAAFGAVSADGASALPFSNSMPADRHRFRLGLVARAEPERI